MSRSKPLPAPVAPNAGDILARRFSIDAASAPPEASTPAPPPAPPLAAELDDIALNPLNERDLASPRTQAKVHEIAESMRVHGQLASCAVVTSPAFLAIFPEHKARVGSATYVHVNGACRHAAATDIGQPTLKIDVMDELAASRISFLDATSAENIDRGDFDPIEEARAVETLIKECGTGKAAAEQLRKTEAWITQRRNLLSLPPEVQEALRGDDETRLPMREVRNWHKLPYHVQLTRLAAWRKQQQSELTAVNSEEAVVQPEERTTTRKTARLSPTASAVRRLGGTPDKIAASLRSELSPQDLDALIELLQRA